jgi:sec-independent protein translocase protein TatA
VFEGLLQPMHLLVLLGIGLIIFGPGKLGELGGQLGRGVREFRDTVNGATEPPNTTRAAGIACRLCGSSAQVGDGFCTACGSRLGESA